MIDIVPDSRVAVGIHVDPARDTAVVLDLAGTVLAVEHTRQVPDEDPVVSLGSISRLVKRVVRNSGIERRRFVGAGLAMPGPVDLVRGCVVRPLWLPAWDGFAVRDQMAKRLDMPVELMLDTLAAVTGETWVRPEAADGVSLVFIYLGIGIGAGVAIDGEALVGASGNGGELGRLQIAISSGDVLGPSSARGLDNDPAILVQRAIAQGVMPGDDNTTAHVAGIDAGFRLLCQLASAGDERARTILVDAGRRIARAAAVVCEIVDADEVVFGGPYWELVREFYEPVAVSVLGELWPAGPHRLRVTGTSMSQDVGAIGAAARVLDGVYVPRTQIMR
jgi:predicted NBD/HSP70 family sugar kinase